MKTFDFFGRFIVGFHLIPRSPLRQKFPITEIEGECRTSVATFIRVWPFNYAIGYGKWQPSGKTPEQVFAEHFHASWMGIHHANGKVDERYAHVVRQQVAAHTDGPDDEWTILSAMGLDE